MNKDAVRDWAPCALGLVLVALFFARELFAGELYFDSDQYFSFLPHTLSVFSAKNPEARYLWSNQILFGYSYAESVLLSYWHFPSAWFFRYFELTTATNLSLAFAASLAYLSTFVLTRILGLSAFAACLSAITFTFSGAITANYCHFNDVIIALSLPLILLLTERSISQTNWVWPALFALVVGNSLAFGHSQFASYNLLAIVVMTIAMIRTSSYKGRRGAALLRIALGLSLALTLAAPHLLALWARIRDVPGLSGGALTEAMDNSRNPLLLLINLIAPFAVAGDLPHRNDPMLFLVNSSMVAIYVGLAPLALAWVGILTKGHALAKSWIYPLLIFALLTFLAPMHWNGFSLLAAFDRLPILGFFHFHSRALFLGSFALALLAGLGLDELMGGSARARKLVLVVPLLTLFISSLATILLVTGWDTLPGWAFLVGKIHKDLEAFLTLWSFTSILTLIFLGLVFLWWRGKLRQELFLTLSFLLVVLDLFNFGHAYKPTLDPKTVLNPTKFSPLLQTPEARLNSRVSAGYYYQRSLAPELRRRSLAFNANLLYAVEETGGHVTPSLPGEFYEFFRRGGFEVPYQNIGWVAFSEEAPSHRLLQMASVTHVLSALDLSPKYFERLSEDEDLKLYAVRDAKPRIYSVKGLQIAESALEGVAAVTTSAKIPEEAVVFAPDAKLAKQYAPAEIKQVERLDTELRFRSQASAPAFIVLTDAFHRNWRATIDGEPTRIYQTNGIFRGLEVPAGEHLVEFRFRNESFELGKDLRRAALFLCLLLLIAAVIPGIAHRLKFAP